MKQFLLYQRFSNHGSRPKIGSRRTLVWVSGTIMGRMGRRQICMGRSNECSKYKLQLNTFFIYKVKIFSKGY